MAMTAKSFVVAGSASPAAPRGPGFVSEARDVMSSIEDTLTRIHIGLNENGMRLGVDLSGTGVDDAATPAPEGELPALIYRLRWLLRNLIEAEVKASRVFEAI
jgi:hypothetical protein